MGEVSDLMNQDFEATACAEAGVNLQLVLANEGLSPGTLAA
jgi:hypothetical protein